MATATRKTHGLGYDKTKEDLYHEVFSKISGKIKTDGLNGLSFC